MKVLHVVAGISPLSGGPTRSVKGICRALSSAGVDVTLLVFGGRDEFENPCGVTVVHGDGSSLDLRQFDLVHIQGLWLWGFHKMAVACRRAKVPYVVSPRGMLDPWALSVKKWKKRLAWVVYQWWDLKHAVAFHVTAEMEKEHVRGMGFKQSCIVAPNGVEMPHSLPPKVSASSLSLHGQNPVGARTAIFLSRLHPGKGLLTLAEAWAKVCPQHWIVKIIGPDSYGHKAEVVAKLDALGIPHFDAFSNSSDLSSLQLPLSTTAASPWIFYDAMNDTEKWTAYRSADLLVHPSVSENFGITIAEALYAELPVICTKGTPWKDVVDCNCGWWIDVGVEPLAVSLREAVSASDFDLRQLGRNGRVLVEAKYTWPAVCKAVVAGYEQALGQEK